MRKGKGSHEEEFEGDGGERGGDFGIRRPLRFLIHQLDLDEGQASEMARILNDIKMERAQADVDQQRSVSAFADALSEETFNTTQAKEAAQLRVHSAEKLRDAILKALEQIHALLKPEQRTRLAFLIRTRRLVI